MPIFDFTCQKCKNRFEKLVLNDQIEIECPVCGSLQVDRETVSLFSCATVQINKRLKMKSEDQLKEGMKRIKRGKPSKKKLKVF